MPSSIIRSTVWISVRCMLYIFVILMFYMHSLLTIPIFSHMNNYIYGMRIFCKTIFISAVYISTEPTTPSYKEHTFCILFFPWLHHFKYAVFVLLHGTNDVGYCQKMATFFFQDAKFAKIYSIRTLCST